MSSAGQGVALRKLGWQLSTFTAHDHHHHHHPRTVKEHPGARAQQLEQGYAGRHLVNNDDIVRAAVPQGHAQRQPQHAQHGKENVQAAPGGARQPGAVHAHREGASARLGKGARGLIVRRVHDHAVAQAAQASGCIHHQALRAAQAQVWVQEGHAQAAGRRAGRGSGGAALASEARRGARGSGRHC